MAPAEEEIVTTRLILLAAALLPPTTLSAARPASAQDAAARTHLGAAVQTGLLVGQADDFLDSGLGVEVTFLREIGPSRTFGLRASAGWLDLEDDRANGIGRGGADNGLLGFLVGAAVQPAVGPLRPYLHGLVGAVANLPEFDGGGPEVGAAWAPAYGGEAGLRLPLGQRPVALEAGMRILEAGELEFARVGVEGGFLTEQDIALIALRLGVTVGL